MTIGSTTIRASFNCDGVMKVFPVPIQGYNATDFVVILTAPAPGGAETQLTLNSDYSLAASSTDAPPKWTLTTLAAAAYLSGYTLQVIGSPIQTNQTQYVQGQAFPSAAVQTNIDRLTQMVQRLQDEVSRAIRVPDGDVNPAMLLPSTAARLLAPGLVFDGSGNVALGALPTVAMTQQTIGALLTPRTPAEVLAGVNPAANLLFYPEGNVRRYGAALNATWNGTIASGTDDSLAFTNAIKVKSAAGGGDVTFDGPTILKNVPMLSYVNVRGIGNPVAYLNPSAASDVHFNALGVVGAAVPVTNALAVGALTLNVANTSTFAVGQYCIVQTTGTSVPVDYVFYGGSALYPVSNGRKQQIARVISIVVNTSITLDTGLAEAYPLASGSVGGAQVAPLPPVTYANPTGAVIGFGLYNFQAQIAIGNNGGGVQIWYGIDFRIRDLTLFGASGYPGIRTIQSAYGDIGFNRFLDAQQVGAGASTGILHDIIESSHYIEVHDNKLSYLTEDEIGMRCYNCQFHHNWYLNAFDSGINVHGNSNFNIDIHDNVIICPQASSGIAIGYSSARTVDSNITIARNRISLSGGKAISVASQGYPITGITAANPAVVTINTVSATNPINVNDVVTITGAAGMTQINGQRATVTATAGASGAWTFTLGSVNSSAYTAWTSGGTAARAAQNVKILDNTIIGWKVTSGSNSPGIQAQFCDDLEVRGNTLDGTTIGNIPDAGISLINCTRPQTANNRVKNCTGGYGMQFVQCAGFDAGSNILFNNQNQCNTSGSSGDCRVHDTQSDTTTNSVENNTPPTVRSWNNTWDGYPSEQRVTVTYTSGVAMTFDASLGRRFELTLTDGVAWTINAPTNPPALAFGTKRITLTVRNSSGGVLGAATFNAVFKQGAWVSPLTGNSRTIEWEWNGANWVEAFRSAQDVPN